MKRKRDTIANLEKRLQKMEKELFIKNKMIDELKHNERQIQTTFKKVSFLMNNVSNYTIIYIY